MLSKVYTKSPIVLDKLFQEIENSTVTVAIDRANTSVLGDQLTLKFKADLSTEEWTSVDSLVSAHDGIAVEEINEVIASISELPEPHPFAKPEYRTKNDATSDIITITPDDYEFIDFQITSERYVSGGKIVVVNAEMGDYVTAEVYDKNSVIPEDYRSAMCENWPSVAKYIVKMWIDPACPMNAIDTRPLNAKITAGLFLRITYYAVNSGSDRKVGINYYLTKKL